MTTPPHLHMTAELPETKIIDLSVNSGWTIHRPFEARVTGRLVQLRGYASKASGASKALLTLPKQLAPDETLLFLGYNSGKPNPTYIEISPNGAINVFGEKWDLTGISTVALDACSWMLITTD